MYGCISNLLFHFSEDSFYVNFMNRGNAIEVDIQWIFFNFKNCSPGGSISDTWCFVNIKHNRQIFIRIQQLSHF